MSQKFYSEVKLEALNNATTDTDHFLVGDSGTIKYRTGTQLLSDLGIAGTYVPYTGATGNVDLGTHTLSSYDLIVNHSSGSGVAASITKGGNGEALTINKTSGSGNAMSVTGGLTSLVDLTLSSIANATIDTDKFIVSDSGLIKYRTGAQVLSDIGAAPAGGSGNYVQNQNASAQSANMWISGSGTFNSSVTAGGFVTTGSSTVTSPIDTGLTKAYFSASSISGAALTLVSDSVGRTLRLYSDTSGSIAAIDANASGLYIGTNTNHNIVFAPNASEKMRITSSGNVGIGTSNPLYTLQVGGTQTDALGIGTTSYGGSSGQALGSISVRQEGGGNGGYLDFQTLHWGSSPYGLQTRMSIDYDGNVGIGTTSPAAKLNVLGSGTTAISISNSNAGTSGSPELTQLNFLGFLQENRARIEATDVASSANGSELRFYNANTSNVLTERMRITSSGNVGIGTTSPVYKTQIVAIGNALLQLNGNNTTGALDTGFTISADDSKNIYLYQRENASTVFGTNNAERMRITSGGNVGIGTTSPAAKLHIQDTNGGIFFDGSGATYNRFKSITSSASVGRDLLFSAQNSGTTPDLYITSTGNVGIGTTSPNKQLTFAQDDDDPIQIRRFTTSQGNPSIGTGISWTWADASTNDETWAAIRVIMPGSGNSNMTFSTTPSGGASGLAERMRITDTGNVGIGTTSPSSRLHVYSSSEVSRIESSNTTLYQTFKANGTDVGYLGNGTGVVSGGSATDFGIQSTNNFVFATGGSSERMRITSAGNVGIGTSYPTGKLDLVDYDRGMDGYGNFNIFTNDSAATSKGGSIAFGGNNSSGGTTPYPFAKIQGIKSSETGSYRGSLRFATAAASSELIERMRIDHNGNVGIGTTDTFGFKTLINSGNSSNNLILFSTTSGVSLTFNDLNTGVGSQIVGVANDLYISTNNTERMRINSSGFVGIGTTTPTYRLQVSDTIASVTAFGNFAALQSIGGAGYRWSLNNDNTFRLQRTTNGFSSITTPIYIDSSDNVGIGTTSPSYPLHVSPQVSNVSIYADYDIVAYSDQSVKENIRPIDNALERVIESRGVLYDRIDSGEKDNIGFIAQELEVAFPELVVTNPDGTKAVKYQNAVAVLFEAVKEQQKQIDEIKRILNGLTN